MGFSGTIQDREELRELYARYCLAIDNGRYDEWIDCFTDDGVFESPRFGRCAGRDGLREFCERHKESLGGARVLHIVTNLSFEIDGDTASGTCYLLYHHCKEGRMQQEAVGHYTDRLRKTPAGWRFQSRQVAICGHN
ncbi:MAG: nuclear transport factor 2 family protein [Candidatus Binataceae bacterium]